MPENHLSDFLGLPFDFGIYYNSRTMYFGIAADHLNTAQFHLLDNIDTASSAARQNVNITGTFGKAFILNDNLVLKSAILVRVTKTAGSMDFSTSLLIKNKILFGFSLRPEALIVLTEINLSKNLRMGIAYDFDGTELSNYNSGSVEFFLGYDIGLSKSKVVSPRYF